MKTVFKILVVMAITSFISCTDTNTEITTENGEIINLQSIDKGDVTAPGSEGGGHRDHEI